MASELLQRGLLLPPVLSPLPPKGRAAARPALVVRTAWLVRAPAASSPPNRHTHPHTTQRMHTNPSSPTLETYAEKRSASSSFSFHSCLVGRGAAPRDSRVSFRSGTRRLRCTQIGARHRRSAQAGASTCHPASRQ